MNIDRSVRSLEERALNAWPALQTVFCDGWVFRLADGYTKRANSANALSPVGSFAAVLPLADSFYRRHGLPPIFRLSPLAGDEPNGVLERAGFQRIDETLVMTATIPADVPPDRNVLIDSVPAEAWASGFAAANRVPVERRRTHDAMLETIRLPAAFATLVEDAAPIAYGLAVAERGMIGLFDIVTVPAARRRGAARRLVSSLLAWGREQGATGAYLQVVATNAPARALYDALGFSETYRYHYRVAQP